MVELILAPMHNVNCLSFRMLCKKCGADTVFTPMINTKAYINNPDNFKWLKKEKPLVAQLIGSEPNDFKECVKNMRNCDCIDLNAGCPSLDNIKTGSGASLLKDLDNFKAIIKTMAKHSNVPVSVKIRLGWKKNDSLKIAKLAELSGADLITIHARKYVDNYSIKADWNAIKKVKKDLKIPVIANGDIDSGIKAEQCLKITNADALMIGRKAMTNPLIFKEIKHFFKTGDKLIHNKSDKIKLMLDYLKLYKKYEDYGFSQLRTSCVLMSSGFDKSTALRNILSKCVNEKELKELLINF